jgi:hypothetical protein
MFVLAMQAKDLKRPPPLEHQQLNHFFKGGALTTKTGLTSHMKGLRWWADTHQDDVFPRSYNLDNADEREVGALSLQPAQSIDEILVYSSAWCTTW